MKFEKGKHKILPALLFLGDMVVTLMRYSSEADLEKTWYRTVLSGREAGIYCTPFSSEHMCCQGKKITGLASNCMQCPGGQGCTPLKGVKVLFSPFSYGWEGFSAEAIAFLMGTVLQRAKQQRSCLRSKLKPALQLFPWKDWSNSALQLFASGLLEPIAVLWPAPAHPSPVGRLQSTSSTKCHVPLPWQVWVAQLGGCGVV